MRCMDRNKSAFWYLLYDGKTMNMSDDGYETGQMSVKYKDAVKMMANISPASGAAQVEQFGQFVSYDKVIVTDDMDCPIAEDTVLFVDKNPEYKDGKPLYDYIVKRVAKSLNSISIAISKVNVS